MWGRNIQAYTSQRQNGISADIGIETGNIANNIAYGFFLLYVVG